MQIRTDAPVDELINKAVEDKELISHMQPGRSKMSASTLVNTIVFEFLSKWYQKKNGGTDERN